jgi:signal transduction histidine kinase/CheY-like chemotaxis protein
MTRSAVVEASGIVLLLFFMLCNMKGVVEIPRLLSILFVNCHSFALCYIEGTVQGAYLYLFPFVMAMIFFLRVRKNDLAVTLFIIFTTANLLGIVLLLPYHATFEIIPDAVAYRHLVMNIIINFLLVVVFFYFVLRLLNAKEKRNVSEKKFTDTILNTSLDAVFVVNPALMEIKQYNDKAAEFFELQAFDKKLPAYSVSQVLGEKIADHINGIGAEPESSKVSERQPPSGNWQNDNVFVRSNGSSFHGFVSLVSFEYAGQHYIKISILDMTSLKVAEFEALQAREKAEKAAAAKTRFMSNMSHELRTPLNAIIGTTYLLIEDEELMQHNDHFRILKNSSEHMLQLVNEVLDFSKLDEGKLEFIREPFDLNDTLRQASDSLVTVCNQKRIQLISDLAALPEGEHAVGDQMRLKQIILNLVSNAVKFTDSGSVTLQTQIKNQVKAYREIYFAVIDTGIGIAPDKLHLIFDSFTQADVETTRKYGGSGLGLSIAKALVKKMGGDLEVASEVGSGSCFYFTLKIPFRQADLTPSTEKIKGLKQLEGVRILLAEDNALNQKIAKRFLRNWGATIHTADNGIIAWELFQEHSFDLLLIDLEMPLMDGKQLLAEVRRIDKEIPAIAFTAAIYDDMYKDLRISGFNGYLHKPFRPDEMQRTILQFLDHI